MTIKPIILEDEGPTHTEYQGWDEWAEKFKPIKNHFSKDPDEIMFETYGEEVEFVANYDNKYVWTNIQGDMSDLIVAGYHYVNRLGYYITEVPWEDEMDYALLSVQVECECYDEERLDNEGQAGSDDCDKCEGYGYWTEYVNEK
jgi:hypothetical protein